MSLNKTAHCYRFMIPQHLPFPLRENTEMAIFTQCTI